MALILPNSAFIHVPRTGGSWTRRVIKTLKIPTIETGNRSTTRRFHAKYSNCKEELEGKFTWSYVRNPLRYLQSLWICNWYPGMPFMPLKKHIVESKTFIEFIEFYLEECPGFVCKRFRQFLEVDGKYPAVDFVGRTENLKEDLIKVLKMTGEKIDIETIDSVEHINKGGREFPKRRVNCEYPPSLQKEIVKSEKEMFDMFYDEEMKSLP